MGGPAPAHRPSQTHLVEAADVAISLVVLRGPTRSWLERLERLRLRRAVERNVQSRCPAFYLVRGLAVLVALASPVVYGIWTAWTPTTGCSAWTPGTWAWSPSPG